MDRWKLHTQGRYLAREDGSPFFWLGDTAWELFHRSTREDAERYLTARAEQGYTVLQIVALAEFEGCTVPNRYGRLPLCFTDGLPDPLRPDQEGSENYWTHVDFILSRAEALGMYVALLPTWGDKFNLKWGKGPEIFHPENAYAYANWLAGRMAGHPNLIWMLGGDRPLETPVHRAVIDAMAKGIRDAGSDALLTYHPMGPHHTAMYLNDAPWLQIHTAQSGHGQEYAGSSDAFLTELRNASGRPYLNAEPRYEDHPACFEPKLGYYWNADDCRQDLYWDILAGACGHTYGNHNCWGMNDTPCDYFPYAWHEAIGHPGARQMRHAMELRLRRDYFSFRPAPELLLRRDSGSAHQAAGMGQGYAYLYTPMGLPLEVDPAPLGAKRLRISWFDPKTGTETVEGVGNGAEPCTFVPARQGKGNDAVLILERV